jgi:hypothetical protein
MLGEFDDELELELLLSEPPPPQAASPRPSSRAAAHAESLRKRPILDRLRRREVAKALSSCGTALSALRAVRPDLGFITVISANE